MEKWRGNNTGNQPWRFCFFCFVSGNDVYVTGTHAVPPLVSAGIVWKNAVPTVLNNGFLNSNPESVFVSGGNVYVAGYD